MTQNVNNSAWYARTRQSSYLVISSEDFRTPEENVKWNIPNDVAGLFLSILEVKRTSNQYDAMYVLWESSYRWWVPKQKDYR